MNGPFAIGDPSGEALADDVPVMRTRPEHDTTTEIAASMRRFTITPKHFHPSNTIDWSTTLRRMLFELRQHLTNA
jgi:hypothetical protein